MEDIEFENIHARLTEVVGSQAPKELAAALGISEQAVYKALRKKDIPQTWVYRISSKYDIQPSWLTTGIGPKHRRRDEESVSEQIEAVAAPHNTCEKCLELYERLYQIGESEKSLMRENADLRVELERLETRFAALVSSQAGEKEEWRGFKSTTEELIKLQREKIEELEEQLKKGFGATDAPASATCAPSTTPTNDE